MRRFYNILIACLITVIPNVIANATEGMWLPLLLGQLNEAEMKSMGMKMNAEDIYSVNKGSLKDAIVSFGGFCTGEVISDQGLILTNHHCGFDAIQNHSSLENDLIQNGFWAYSRDQELNNPGLTATFIIRIEDVTKELMDGVSEEMFEKDRQALIDKNMERVKKSAARESWQEVMVRAMFEGNQYFLFVMETYRDVRLVGAPPSSIGKFGSDTDNWVWPRHTGDFSMFRIYAGKDNKPADYSPDNVPYKPRHSLPISLDGVKEGDFTMVMGFPGRTQEYLPAVAVKQIQNVIDPARIGVRDVALKIIDVDMRSDAQVKIQYAAKYASVANAWKKWIGEVQGLKAKKAVARKLNYEEEFLNRVRQSPTWVKQHGDILQEFEQLYTAIEPYAIVREYQRETFSNTELLSLVTRLNGLLTAYEKNGEEGYNKQLADLKGFLSGFYKEYQSRVDKKVFASLVELYMNKVPAQYIGDDTRKILKKYNNDYKLMADKIYQKSAIPIEAKLMSLLAKKPVDAIKSLKKDPAFVFGKSLISNYNANVDPKIQDLQPRINKLQRRFMKAQMDAFNDRRFYPDANSTLRVTYGNVKGYVPRDAVYYEHYSYLDGIMEKYIPGDYEFDVPAKLITLYQNKDFGVYSDGGKMPVCFIGSNHTTGGNSGSPAIDAYGNLIGLNFDRVWEGTMSDINYDPSICRNIMVDARYILFIVDKFAGATNLIKEMKLVHPKG